MLKKILPILIPILLIVGYYVGRKIYFTPNYGKSEIAPTFQGTMPNGETFELKDLQGNYVLLEFWGSWCGDCRKEHPHLVQTYDMFHSKKFKDAKDFEIVSVGLETREQNWLHVIQKDDLKWKYHTVQLSKRSSKMFDQPLAKKYGIRWAPTSFLISPQGKILKVNPSQETLRTFLNQKLQ